MSSHIENEAAQFFSGALVGRWRELPHDLEIPAYALEDSSQWINILLNRSFNTNRQSTMIRRRMYLGLRDTPDKLVSALEGEGGAPGALRIHETLQNFIVTRYDADVPRRKRPLSYPVLSEEIERLLLTLSDEAVTVVRRHLKTFTDDPARALRKALRQTPISLISDCEIPIGSLVYWHDRVDIVLFEGSPYFSFFKTYPGSAVPIFTPGLEWFVDLHSSKVFDEQDRDG